MFHDCLNREIKVGDVLACGQRQGSHGGMIVGVVRGFTEKSILADILHGGYDDWWEFYETRRHTSWRLKKGHFNADYNCCITGMTEADLRAIVEGQENKEEPCIAESISDGTNHDDAALT